MRNMVVVSDHMGVSWGVLTKFGRPLGPEPVRWGVAERWKDAIPARAIMLSSRTNNTSVLPGKMCFSTEFAVYFGNITRQALMDQ